MKENQEYVRKKRPINFTMDDLDAAKELDDDLFIATNIKPSTTRVLPSRNCKPKNFHESDDKSEHKDMNTISGEIPRYVLESVIQYFKNPTLIYIIFLQCT